MLPPGLVEGKNSEFVQYQPGSSRNMKTEGRVDEFPFSCFDRQFSIC